MNRRLVALLAVSALFATGACGDDADSKDANAVTTTSAALASPEGLTLSSAMNGSTQNLRVGQNLVIELDTAGGSGYSWKVTTEPDAAVLKFVSATQEKKSTDTTSAVPLTGTPEVATTTFRAVGAGTTKVVLGHVPPSGDAPEDTFSVTVTVTT